MAFSNLGGIGTAAGSAASATLVITTSADADAGDLVVVWVAWDNDNAATSTTVFDPEIRCDDSEDNDYRTLASGQNTQGTQAAGTHASIFGAVLDTDLPSGSTITLTHTVSAARVAKAASAHRFGCSKKNVHVALNGATHANGTAADPASISLASLPGSTEYLLLHCVSFEGPGSDTYTQDADYTGVASAASAVGGGDASEQTVRGGFRIATLTGDTVDASNSTGRDHKQLLVAIRESNAPYIRWAPGKVELATLNGASANAVNINLNGTIPANCAWARRGDVVMLIHFSQQTTNIAATAAQSTAMQSFQPAGTQRISVGDITYGAWWMRMTDSSAITLTGQDVSPGNGAAVIVIGGCNQYGTPFEVLGEGTEAADTSVEFPAGSSSFDEELIMLLVAHGIDATTAQVSGYTNSSLTHLEEITDICSNLASGHGLAAAVGVMETAGSVGTSTATLAASDVDATQTLGWKPKGAPEPTTPYVRRHLACGQSSAALALSWNAAEVEADDLIVLFVNSESQDVTTPTDYNEFPDSPQDTTGCRLEAFYKIADGTETGVTIADSGDHQIATALAIANIDVSGTVYDVTSGGVEATSDTSLSATGDTTTIAGDFVLIAAAHSLDAVDSTMYDFQNTDLEGFPDGTAKIEHFADITGTAGAGGGVCVAGGIKSSAGAFGATTATLLESSPKAFITIALKAVPIAITGDLGKVSEINTSNAIAWYHRVLLSQVSQIDIANSITPKKIVAFTQVSEIDTSQLFASKKVKAFGQVSEINTSTDFPIIKSIGLISEVNTAQSISALKKALIAMVLEIDTAQEFPSAAKSLEMVLENNFAQTIFSSKALSISQAEEISSAVAFILQLNKQLNFVSEIDTANTIDVIFQVILGFQSRAGIIDSNYETEPDIFVLPRGTDIIRGRQSAGSIS